MRQVRTDIALAIGAALWSVLLISAIYGQIWPLSVDIGGRDARFALGFNEPETTADGNVRYRWSDGESVVALPRPPSLAASQLAISLLNGRPDGQPAPQMQIAADDRALAAFPVTDNRFRTYRLLIPPADQFSWGMNVTLASDAIVPEADPRPLGVVVNTVSLMPQGEAMVLPPLFALFCALSLGALAYTLPRLAGMASRAALVFGIGLPALVAIGMFLRPAEVLPFLQRFPMLLSIAVVGALLARLLIPLQATATETPRIAGMYLPVAMAIAWWMAPLVQLGMIADGAPSVGLAPQTLWIGAALISALVLGCGGWLLTRGKTLPPDEQRAGIARIVFGALAVAALAHLTYNLWYAYTRQAPDFWILFRGSREWTRGGSMYDLEAVMTNHFGHVFKVPPFYGMLFTPFVTLDGMMVLLGHRIMNTILIIATALLWMRMWNLPAWSLGVAALAIVFNFRPLADTLAYGQIDLMLLFLLTAALWALRGGQDIAAGALVALGTLFKIYPVILLAFFVAKWRWRALAGFALGMLVYNGIAVAIIGWEEHVTYLTQVTPNIGGTTSWVENQTISGFLARFTDSPRSASIYEYDALRWLGMLISGAISLAVCILALRPAPRETPAYALQYGMFLLLMVLAVPAAWMHYETLLIVPFGALLLHLRERAISLPYAILLALSFALIAYGNQWSFYDGTVHGMLTIAGVSYKFYGMLLLGGMLTAEVLRLPAPALLPQLSRLIARPEQG